MIRAPPAKLHGPQADLRFDRSCASSGATDKGTAWSTVVAMTLHFGPRIWQYGSSASTLWATAPRP